jgi:hypothetical protein
MPLMVKVDKKYLKVCRPELETETWQPGVIENKSKKHHTYLVAINYWAPLNNDNKKENESDEEEANVIKLAQTTTCSRPLGQPQTRRQAR